MKRRRRELGDLGSIGKEMLKDFDLLGIKTVEQLAKENPQKLYDKLPTLSGTHHSVCVLDTFYCAVAQAKSPNLPKAQKNWWYWSSKRKLG